MTAKEIKISYDPKAETLWVDGVQFSTDFFLMFTPGYDRRWHVKREASDRPIVGGLVTVCEIVEPKWVDEKPTEPGWYWVSQDGDDDDDGPRIVEVVSHGRGFYVYGAGSEESSALSSFVDAKWKRIPPEARP